MKHEIKYIEISHSVLFEQRAAKRTKNAEIISCPAEHEEGFAPSTCAAFWKRRAKTFKRTAAL